MKLISWNVNGVRAALNKGLADFFAAEAPDILCLQETKAQQEQVDMEWLDSSYHQFWNSAEKKGYSGTAIFSKKKPLSVSYGFGKKEHDGEGRVITVEFSSYFVVTVYTPNSQNELRRLDYRMEWDKAFLKHLRKLEKTKPVIFCGDLNVAHKEIDLARPKANRKNAGFSDEERAGFDMLVDAGFVDTFREFDDGPDNYSWWSYRAGARGKNVGWRLDYWCVSEALRKKLKAASILSDVMGSDHCPVVLELKQSR
ncbi:MAG: exodeoxyribonuclease-3 [Verrucomicrobiales bacterium]|jgi:exodeoxyribonuclease-3